MKITMSDGDSIDYDQKEQRMSDNLRYWNKLHKPPTTALKAIGAGRLAQALPGVRGLLPRPGKGQAVVFLETLLRQKPFGKVCVGGCGA